MLKLNFKTVFLCALTLAASAAHASDAFYFFNPQNRIGCATITSVRNVNQAPLYDREYEMLMGGRGGSANLAIIVSGLGIVGAAGAVAASLAIDAVRDPSVAVDGVQTPADGTWTNVQALRVEMDDGNVMNIPLTAQPKLTLGPKYEVGRRVTVYLLKDRNSIQLGLGGRAPLPGDKLHDGYCKRGVSQSEAEAALKEKANLVQEDKIIG